MRDDGVPAMQLKFLYTSPNWGPEDGILMWHQNKDGKCMLPNGDLKPCKPILMRNELEIIIDICGFIDIEKNFVRKSSLYVFGIHMNR